MVYNNNKEIIASRGIIIPVMHITSVALGSHCSDGDEHEATVSPTRTRPVSQW